MEMLKTALLPLSTKESKVKLTSMINFLTYFGTEKIFIIHVLGNSNISASRKEKIQTIQKNIKDIGFETTVLFRTGHVATAVGHVSMEIEIDYICIPWKPKGILKKTLLGSVTNDLIRLTDLPIFIYKKKKAFENGMLESVMYATDFQSTDKKVMPYLRNKDFQAQNLYLLHVGERAPDPESEAKRKDEVEIHFQRLISECSDCFETVKTINIIGPTKSKIIRQANKHNVDLIILGKFDKEKPLEQLMGSTAELIPYKSRCSVFIVPGIKTKV